VVRPKLWETGIVLDRSMPVFDSGFSVGPKGAVSARASNSGEDYVKPLAGPTTFFTDGPMADDERGAAE